MAVSHDIVTVATTAVALNTAGSSGQPLYISNGAAIVYLGASDVTTTTGVALAANAAVTLQLDAGDVLYAICATSSDVGVLSL